MRLVFVLIFLAGIAAGLGYPWIANNFSGEEIGRFPVYERGGDFRPVTVDLAAADAPVRVLVDMVSIGQPVMQADRTVLTLTATVGGKTVLADTLSFVHASARDVNPQLQERIFRDSAGLIDPVTPGSFLFTLGRGDAEAIAMKSVELVLRREAMALDPRIQPIGFALMAIGVIGFVLAMRRRRAARNQAPQTPPPPKWGRGSE
ncbi:MAG: hypothetical protein JNL61_19270 [Rhizobiaceae bacterium]|nr:hypothetical protein [Rhizobiaceae bacterium]